MSLLVTLRGGECMTGTGGEGGPRGAFLCLNFGRSSGSTGASCIWMMRSRAPELVLPLPSFGMYRRYSVSFFWLISGRAVLAAVILPLRIFSRAAWVS